MGRWTRAMVGVALALVAAGCGADVGDAGDGWDEAAVGAESGAESVAAADGDSGAASGAQDADRRGMNGLRAVVARADALVESPGLSDAHRRAVVMAAARVRQSTAALGRLRRRGGVRRERMSAIGGAAALLLADDSTGIGVADDPLLVVCAVAAVATVLMTADGASRDEIDAAFARLAADVAALRDAIEAATATRASAQVCRRPAPRVRAGPEPGPRGTADVSPTPADPDGDDHSRGMCARMMPQLRRCGTLPAGYVFRNHSAALREMKRATANASLALGKRERTRQPPCAERGLHVNVRDGGRRAGSLTSCDCCVDTVTGPRREERWRIIW